MALRVLVVGGGDMVERVVARLQGLVEILRSDRDQLRTMQPRADVELVLIVDDGDGGDGGGDIPDVIPDVLHIARARLPGAQRVLVVEKAPGTRACVAAMRAGATDILCGDEVDTLPSLVRSPDGGQPLSPGQHRKLSAMESGALFRSLIEHTRDGVTISGRDRTVFYMNAAAAQMLGAAKDVSGTVKGVDLVAPEDRERLRAVGDRLRATPGQWAETELRTLSGRIIEAWTINLLDDPAVGGLVSHLRDVTERKATARALAQSQTRLGRLIDANILGVVVADLQGKALEANDAYLDMLGFDRADLAAGRVHWRGPTPLDEARVQALRTTGVVKPFERPLFKKDGSVVTVLVAIALLDDKTCIGMAADLTERERIARALEEKEQQFRQAQKMEAVGRLAGGIAHDFNNILSVILSFSELVLDGLYEKDPLYADLAEIKKAAVRAADLVKQLLIFSRHQVLEPQIVDVNETLAQMERMLPRLLGDDIDIVTVPSANLDKVVADPNAIEQVVMNLVVNARDAMPDGGTLTIETANAELDEEFVRAHHGTKTGPHVMLAVTDTGLGMDRATQMRLFEPFFTTKHPGKGTGLGLSTVFGIVQQAGGSVWVSSELGHGSTFKIYLPRAAAAAAEAPAIDAAAEAASSSPAPPPSPPSPPAPVPAKGGERVLLVEDEDGVRGVARVILKRGGYEVLEAKNGVEALALFDEIGGRVDIVCTDVVMPRMGGTKLAEELRKRRPGIRILFMSGYTDDTMVRQGLIEGAIELLQKPFTLAGLTAKIRQMLDADPPPPPPSPSSSSSSSS